MLPIWLITEAITPVDVYKRQVQLDHLGFKFNFRHDSRLLKALIHNAAKLHRRFRHEERNLGKFLQIDAGKRFPFYLLPGIKKVLLEKPVRADQIDLIV